VAAIEGDDCAAGRRNERNLWPPAVDKNRLSLRHFVADLDVEERTQTTKIAALERNGAHWGTVAQGLGRGTWKRNVATASYRDLHFEKVFRCPISICSSSLTRTSIQNLTNSN
jgi:hypothetical protein